MIQYTMINKFRVRFSLVIAVSFYEYEIIWERLAAPLKAIVVLNRLGKFKTATYPKGRSCLLAYK